MFEDDWNVTINKEASDIIWKVSNCLKLTVKENIKILETWEFTNPECVSYPFARYKTQPEKGSSVDPELGTCCFYIFSYNLYIEPVWCRVYDAFNRRISVVMMPYNLVINFATVIIDKLE
jgi:hypothetical protein